MKTLLSTIALVLPMAGCNLIFGTDDYTVSGAGAAPQGGENNGAGSEGGAGGGGAGIGGEGGTSPEACDLPITAKPTIELSADIQTDQLLTCDKNYRIVGELFVKAPATLTIQAGTTVFGDLVSGGVLVVETGAKLEANGQQDRPIVFTSEGGEFSDPGDWGGVVLLGRAPINEKDINGLSIQKQAEGLVTAALFGGDDPNDDSGSLQYVRFEYGGTAVAPGNEVNGLTLNGVGDGTLIDHVMVRKTTDDCFEFFGGTVNAKHLICQAPGDDGIDWDLGYVGKIQFAIVQQDVALEVMQGDMNGFEGDNDATGSANAPLSSPTIFNATLCGQNYGTGEQYGTLLRKATRGNFGNLFVSGFEGGIDLRNAVDPALEIRGSLYFGNVQVAYPETAPAPFNDDDGGVDEIAWLNGFGNTLSATDPGIPGCNEMGMLELKPDRAITGVAPPDDGFFDATATYKGAFRDADDDWATGAWVKWQAQ